MTRIFDGIERARERELLVKQRVVDLGYAPRLASVVFDEDKPSQIYTQLKWEAAIRVGMEFDKVTHSYFEDIEQVKESIGQVCGREDVHGVLIQKPGKREWVEAMGRSMEVYDDWWRQLVGQLDYRKDVDCLTKYNQDLLYAGKGELMPATVKAVMEVLREVTELRGKKVVVLGRSDIVGAPLAAVLERMGATVYALGSKTTDLSEYTRQADIVVSATGRKDLVVGEMVKDGVIAIDVGSPSAEFEWSTVSKKASFITPVPNGVGPVTVVCLLENMLELVSSI